MGFPDVPKAERLLLAILRKAEERYKHELMDDEERMLLLDRITRLRRCLSIKGGVRIARRRRA
jgi:hypothetical protein